MHFVQESSYRLHLRTKAAEHREEVAAGEAPPLPVPGWAWLFPSLLPLPSPQLRPAGEEPGRKAEPLALGRLLLVVVVLRLLLLLLLLRWALHHLADSSSDGQTPSRLLLSS